MHTHTPTYLQVQFMDIMKECFDGIVAALPGLVQQQKLGLCAAASKKKPNNKVKGSAQRWDGMGWDGMKQCYNKAL